MIALLRAVALAVLGLAFADELRGRAEVESRDTRLQNGGSGDEDRVGDQEHHCVWVSLEKNHVWVNTLDSGSGGFVQMGYISAIFDGNYPDIYPSGQPNVTEALCQHYCDALGPQICAASQFYACEAAVAAENWCDLLTPTEFTTSLENTGGQGVLIHPVESIFVGKSVQIMLNSLS